MVVINALGEPNMNDNYCFTLPDGSCLGGRIVYGKACMHDSLNTQPLAPISDHDAALVYAVQYFRKELDFANKVIAKHNCPLGKLSLIAKLIDNSVGPTTPRHVMRSILERITQIALDLK